MLGKSKTILLCCFAISGAILAVILALNIQPPDDKTAHSPAEVSVKHQQGEEHHLSSSQPRTSALDKSNDRAKPSLQSDSAEQALHALSREPAAVPYNQQVNYQQPYDPHYATQFNLLQKTLDAVKEATSQNEEVLDTLKKNQAEQQQQELKNQISQAVQEALPAQSESVGAPQTSPFVIPEQRQESATAAGLERLPAADNTPTPAQLLDIKQADNGPGLALNIHNSEIGSVLELLSEVGGLNILASENVTGTVSATLSNASLEEALQAILTSRGYVLKRDGKFIYVGTPEDLRGIQLLHEVINTRIYQPNYVTATELQTLIAPILTEGVGQSTVTTQAEAGIAADGSSAGGNNLAGNDVLLIKDYESVLMQVDQILREVDLQPKQVAIEAMILSVKLDDSNSLGVDFELLRDQNNVRLASGAPLASLGSMTFNDGGMKFGFLDSNLALFISALETIGDTNVIASPRLTCLNKQKAEILIGAELGYVSTTVTDTTATQSVEFLEVGTQLRIRPYISNDGIIRMEVHPELSSGTVRVEGNFTLPDKEVTQVTTNIMCRDGSTVIIGGLIREDLTKSGSQIPFLGNLPLLGTVFRNRTENIDRRELIVLITPRIINQEESAREGAETVHNFAARQAIYADKMSPIGKRYYGRRYLNLAQAATCAGDYDAALKYTNLSIHFNPLDESAIRLRSQIIAVSQPELDMGNRLRYGLGITQHPHGSTDYTSAGSRVDQPFHYFEPLPQERVHIQGEPGSISNIPNPLPPAFDRQP